MGLKGGSGWAGLLDLLERALSLCRGNGFRHCVGLEDASRSGAPHLEKVIQGLLSLKVERVRLADTVGVLTPMRTAGLVGAFASRGFKVEFHAHNDLGLADANSLMAALNGACHVDCTLGGIGERAGNASLLGFVRLAALSGRLSFNTTVQKAAALEERFLPLFEREGFLSRLCASKSADITRFGGAAGPSPGPA
jgi:homocitrate synthase NifV